MSSNGQILGAVVGAVVGFFTAGAGWAATAASMAQGAAIGMTVGGLIDPPKGPNITGPRLGDLSVQSSTYAAPLPRIYGTVATMGNVFWVQGDSITETSKTEKVGGKGGGGSSQTTFTYSATFAVGLAKVSTPVAGVRRVWVGADLIYDAGSDDPAAIASTSNSSSLFKFYNGDESQLPDPRIQADKGVANTPAYRGIAYIVFYDFALANYGNSLMGAQVKVELVAGGLGLQYEFKTSGALSTGFQYDAVVAGNGMHLASGLGSTRVYKTLDGITWTYSNFSGGSGSNTFGACAFGAGVFVYTTSSNVIQTSRNGSSWITATSAVSVGYTWRSIVFNGKAFVAVGYYGEVMYSLDGMDWVAGEQIGYLGYVSQVMTNGAGDVVALGMLSEVLAVSKNNGENWTFYNPSGMRSIEAYPNNCAVYGGGKYMFANSYGDVFTSTNGANWTKSTFPIANYVCTQFVYGNGIWLALSGQLKYLVSTNFGATWTESEPTEVLVTPSAGIFDGSKFCIFFSLKSQYAESKDGITWAYKSIPPLGNIIHSTLSDGVLVLGGDSLVAGRLKIGQYTEELSNIVSSECALSNLLSPSDIDVTALTDTVRGYRVSSMGAIRAAISPLQGAFPFDVIQSGYKIKFKKRGGTSVQTVPFKDLDARSVSTEAGVQITNSREMDSVLPSKISLRYLDTGREYDNNEQYAERLNTPTVNTMEMGMALVLTSTEAAQKAEVLLYMYWLERYDVSFRLPPSYNMLEPSDVIVISGDNASYNLRLTNINYTSDGRLECQAKYNDAATYVSTATGDTGSSLAQGIKNTGPSQYIMMDLPCLRDEFDKAGFPAAMASVYSGWSAGAIYRTVDNGQTWQALQTFTDIVPMGFSTNALASGRYDIVDTKSTLTVSMLAGELFSVSLEQMLNGANFFAVGADGRWEIIAAQNCELQANGTYILSDLLRGRAGTEWAIGTHKAADNVVLLTDDDIAFINTDNSALGMTRQYRGVTVGAPIDSDTSRDFKYAGVNLKPLSPVYLNGGRDGANNWSLNWIRRSRVDNALRDFVDVPIGEATEAYQVEIYTDNTYATVKRTIDVIAPSATYSIADQTTDFGSTRATLYLKIYQMSAAVGRGYELKQSITG